MIRGLVVVAVVALLPQQQTFRSGAEAVRVDALVTDGPRPVAGLTAANFEVRDNGVLQKIEAVTLGDVPLSVLLALDTSASVQGVRLDHLRDATSASVAALGPADRAALLTFSHRLALAAPFGDPRRASLAVSELAASGGTAVFDAAFTALVERDPGAVRSLVLIFSDGEDTASWLTAEALLEAARRSDAVVYAITLKDKVPVNPFRVDIAARLPSGLKAKPGRDVLEDLARETGGRVFAADGGQDLRHRFVDAIREFKSRYLLTYSPAGVDGAGWHSIDVSLKGARGRVQARRGYQR